MDFAEKLLMSSQNIEEWYGPSTGAQKIYWGWKVVRSRSGSWCKNCMSPETWKWRILMSYARWGHLSKFFSALPGAACWALASLLWQRIWLVETVLSLYPESYKQYFVSQGVFAKFWLNRKSATWWHVLVHIFGVARLIPLRFWQCGVKRLRNDMVRALELRKFIEDGKWWDQGRVRGAKIAWPRNLENEEFCWITVAAGTCLKFFGLSGAVRWALAPPLWQGQKRDWC